MEKSNFRPRVVEAPRLGVELEFHEKIPGLTSDTVTIYLRENATVAQAEKLRDAINEFGWTFRAASQR